VVVEVFGDPSALDELTSACRVAPDEAMLVDDAGALGVQVDDPHAVTLDATDGWSAFVLAGDAARDAFERLSALELPADGYVQGDVAHVPTRVIAEPGRVTLLAPAMWGAHLRAQILARCASLGIREVDPS
jgi:hypothetical protein